jgi:hypothetical protein
MNKVFLEHNVNDSKYQIDTVPLLKDESNIKENDRCGRYSFIFKVNNNHSYLITDQSIKKQIQQCKLIKQDNSSFIGENIDLDNAIIMDTISELLTFCEGKTCSNERINIVIKNNDWENVVDSVMSKTNRKISLYNTSGKCITDFIYPLEHSYLLSGGCICVYIRPNYDFDIKINRQLNDFKNKCSEHDDLKDIEITDMYLMNRGISPTQIYSELVKSIIGHIPRSDYNENIVNYLDKFKRPSLVEQYRVDDEDDVYGIDINKADSYATMNLLDDIPIYTHHDTIELFNETDEIECGLYHLKSFFMFQDKHLLIPEGFYTSGFVKQCLECKIITKTHIKQKYIPKCKLAKDTLNKTTKFIFTVFDEKEAKTICNNGVGSWGKLYTKKLDSDFTNSWEVANAMSYNGYYPKKTGNYLFMRKLFRNRMRTDNRPLYNSIIEASIWRLYEVMCEYVNENTELYAIKRDCIFGKYFNEIKEVKHNSLFDSMGSVKIE